MVHRLPLISFAGQPASLDLLPLNISSPKSSLMNLIKAACPHNQTYIFRQEFYSIVDKMGNCSETNWGTPEVLLLSFLTISGVD